MVKKILKALLLLIFMSSCALVLHSANATVSSQVTEVSSALGNGSTTNYTISFPFLDNDDIQVYLRDESTSTVIETLLTYASGAGHYTISGGDPGTTVVMGTAPNSSQRVKIKRHVVRTQPVDYDENAAFPFSDHEEQMDRTIMALQELSNSVDNIEVSGVSTPLPVTVGGTGTNLAGSTGVVKVTAGVVSVSTITDSDIANNAAITRTKLASSSVHGLLINDAQGNIGASSLLPPNLGGTGAATLTANNVILGNGIAAVQFVAPGTSGNVLQSNGSSWISGASTVASTPAYWSGYMSNDCTWSSTTTSFADPSADATCTCVQLQNNGMSTVSTDAASCTSGAGTSGSRTPQIKFYVPRAGVYKITAVWGIISSSGGGTNAIQMTDGSNVLIGSEQAGSNASPNGLMSVGFLSASTVTQYTVKQRVYVTGGTGTFGANFGAPSNNMVLFWTIEEFR